MSASLAARPPAVALPLPLPPKVSTRSSVDSRHSAYQTWLLADAACSSPEEVVEEEAEETEEPGVLQGSLIPQVPTPAVTRAATTATASKSGHSSKPSIERSKSTPNFERKRAAPLPKKTWDWMNFEQPTHLEIVPPTPSSAEIEAWRVSPSPSDRIFPLLIPGPPRSSPPHALRPRVTSWGSFSSTLTLRDPPSSTLGTTPTTLFQDSPRRNLTLPTPSFYRSPFSPSSPLGASHHSAPSERSPSIAPQRRTTTQSESPSRTSTPAKLVRRLSKFLHLKRTKKSTDSPPLPVSQESPRTPSIFAEVTDSTTDEPTSGLVDLAPVILLARSPTHRGVERPFPAPPLTPPHRPRPRPLTKSQPSPPSFGFHSYHSVSFPPPLSPAMTLARAGSKRSRVYGTEDDRVARYQDLVGGSPRSLTRGWEGGGWIDGSVSDG